MLQRDLEKYEEMVLHWSGLLEHATNEHQEDEAFPVVWTVYSVYRLSILVFLLLTWINKNACLLCFAVACFDRVKQHAVYLFVLHPGYHIWAVLPEHCYRSQRITAFRQEPWRKKLSLISTCYLEAHVHCSGFASTTTTRYTFLSVKNFRVKVRCIQGLFFGGLLQHSCLSRQLLKCRQAASTSQHIQPPPANRRGELRELRSNST